MSIEGLEDFGPDQETRAVLIFWPTINRAGRFKSSITY
jgi:hypothetical protein